MLACILFTDGSVKEGKIQITYKSWNLWEELDS